MAARQLQANLDRPERQTHPAGLAVYGRRGLPCHRCGTPVRMARHGDLARSTYWCPRCQARPEPS
jgi:endonuclease-8